ncbi:MAG: hypothetical protein WD009_05260 [Phycisphaeraceae bacterium]
MSTTIGSAAAMLAVVAMLLFGEAGTLVSPTWADVVRQTRGVEAAHLDIRAYEGGRLVTRGEYFVQQPSTVRNHEYEIVDGEAVATEGAIMTPEGGVRWNERTRLGQRVRSDNPYVVSATAAEQMLGLLGMSLLADAGEQAVRINGDVVRFAQVQRRHPQDAELQGYALRSAGGGPALPPPFNTMVYWFDGQTNELRRLSGTYTPTGPRGEARGEEQRVDVVVRLEPDLPADWFALEVPAEYHDVEAGVRPRLSPEVREVYDAVARAREAFGDYRAVIWRDTSGGWPMYREARRGERWRADEILWTVMHRAVHGDNEQGFVRIGPSDPFEDVWEQVTREDYELQSSVMARGEHYALVHYNLGGRRPRVSAKLQESLIGFGDQLYWGHTLAQLAWPEWIWTENLHPHGWDLRHPPLAYHVLPANPDQPNLVEVVGEREHPNWGYVRYTFDRSRDYLCVRREHRELRSRARVWQVEAFGQTPEGRWYPTRVRYAWPTVDGGDLEEPASGGNTYQYAVDTSAPAAGGFFAWPEGVPQPVDAFAGLRSLSRRIGPAEQAERQERERELPATARGKYVTFEARGLPRGFDDEQTAQAHSRMGAQMRRLKAGIDDYAHAHNWMFPENLEFVVEASDILTQADLENPLHPDADPPYGYIRPDFSLPNRLERMVLHEPFDAWPGVVTVMFQDGSVEHIHDEAEFERLLREATAPEPPARPDDE